MNVSPRTMGLVLLGLSLALPSPAHAKPKEKSGGSTPSATERTGCGAPEPCAEAGSTDDKKPKKDTKTETPFWASPWFWGSVGGVTAVGVTVFILSRTTSNSGTVHIDGTVGR